MNHKKSAVMIVLLGAGGVAQAQTLIMKDLGNGFQGAASVDLAWVHTDNFFFQPKENGGAIGPAGTPVPEVAANGYFVRPNILIDRDVDSASFKLRVAGEYSNFNLPEDFERAYETDNLDGTLSGSADWRLGTRNRLNLLGEFRHGHDAFGAVKALPSATAAEAETDKWDQTFASATWRLGAQEAAFNFDIKANTRDRHYVSNETTTKRLDFRTDVFGVATYYNYSPKTALVFDYEHANTDYDEKPGRNYDTSEDRIRGGVQWKATAKTTGDLRIGYVEKSFDASDAGQGNLTWLASVSWTPAARTTFNLLTGRSTQESYLINSSVALADTTNALSIDNRDYSLEWAQRWGTRFSTYMSARYINSDFLDVRNFTSGPVVTEREDDVKSLSLSAEYRLVKYASFLASVTSADRNSSVLGADYENLVTYVGVRLIP